MHICCAAFFTISDLAMKFSFPLQQTEVYFLARDKCLVVEHQVFLPALSGFCTGCVKQKAQKETCQHPRTSETIKFVLVHLTMFLKFKNVVSVVFLLLV